MGIGDLFRNAIALRQQQYGGDREFEEYRNREYSSCDDDREYNRNDREYRNRDNDDNDLEYRDRDDDREYSDRNLESRKRDDDDSW